MNVSNDEFQYDKQGRIKYNPKHHHKHKTHFSEKDLEYLCKYWETDGLKSLSHALGRPEGALKQKLSELRKTGKLEYYQNQNKHWCC